MRGLKSNGKKIISAWYESLFDAFGPQGWWPGRTRFEVIVGAILTQNTAWTNVEKAIAHLKKARLLTPERMHGVAISELAELIRPAGYFNVKAKRLKNFTAHLFENHDGSLDSLFRRKTAPHPALPRKGGGDKEAPIDLPSPARGEEIWKRPSTCPSPRGGRRYGSAHHGLRAELLSVSGIGPETADSILLYAGGHPEFVVDAYTKRIAVRHGLAKEGIGYEELKSLFMENLIKDARVFNEYHALIVKTGKDFCKTKKPLCAKCPLKKFLD